jgi:CRP/FNR family transcriptional regulator, cyclic AMP receptor protein
MREMEKLNSMSIQRKCSDCEMRSDNFFCDLPESDLKIFESLKITNAYPKGSTLFMEGQPSNGVYMLCQGKVKLSTCSKDGKVIILHIAEAGEVLGLSPTISDSVHVATAEVIEDCQVNFIRNEDFVEFLKANSEACMSAVKQLSSNYQTAYLQICSLGLSSSVSDKLAKLFLGWCKTADSDSNTVHLKVSYTHEEIAEMIGTSRETVTRLLKEFKERKLVTRKGADLIIHDRDGLESSIGGS